MKHVMIDLETLSSNSHAAIIQIGACVFDLKEIHQGFRAAIKPDDAMRFGEVSGATLKWWMEQEDAARKSVMSGTDALETALRSLNTFVESCGGKGACFWAHATFDFPILMNAYEKVGIKPSLSYKRMRDLRTLEDFFGRFITWDERTGTHHDALDDARYQAHHAQKMLRIADTTIQRQIDDK